MQKFQTPAPIVAILDIPAGHVRFIATDRDDTTVEVRPADATRSRDVKVAQQTAVDFHDGVLRIVTPAPKNQILTATGSVEVTVELPAGSRVEAKAAAGELRGAGRLGEVAFEVSQGSIELDEAAGARLTALAGDIRVGRLRGDADISTQKGDIRVGEAHEGALILRTQAGDVTVGAAPGVAASLDAGTGHGRVHNALKNTGGAAALTVHATTGYGDITARSL
ncbi:hypothetical protein SLAV_16920 [Streptomyces lavendulae subsp. lavendulae]|uniref:DUF4097 domain-containing protein n=1 Tax=Streptomyces lavendulae subsp. lavendulae TaxID=58340 RepID=A0A2K8PER8_STRLA|nr:DUF4097 family beta strand repeat-containing protein [Streptomyces lavendulae]ATZ25234.1 hypothetical protein SLAV_16920 [Streptomyces lavendulae subsp. lavendulae]QUQ55064.1 hypothetical protein SLLC_14985 [Streptomyces lavendulae subsp. lavendulae]